MTIFIIEVEENALESLIFLLKFLAHLSIDSLIENNKIVLFF